MAAAAPSAASRRAALAFIYVTALLDMLAFGLAIPVLPFLYEELAGGQTHRAAEMAGFFGLAFAAMQFVFGPVLGSLSDRFGRRPVILLSNFGLAADYALMALAPSLAWLFVGRVLAGITSASFSTASAYIADTAPPEKRAQAFGMLGALFSVGFILGPALGGELGQANHRLPFWIAGGLSLANALCGIFVLPESLPRALRSRFSWRRANPVGSIGLLRASPALRGGAPQQSRPRREPARVRLLRDGSLRVRRGTGRPDADGRRHRRRARVGCAGRSHRAAPRRAAGAAARARERNARLRSPGLGARGLLVLGGDPPHQPVEPLRTRHAGAHGPARRGLGAGPAPGRPPGAAGGLCALATPLLYTQAFSRGSAFTAGAPYWLAAGLVGAALLLALRAAAPVPATRLPEVR